MFAKKICVILIVVAALDIYSVTHGAPLQPNDVNAMPAAGSDSNPQFGKTRSAVQELEALEKIAEPVSADAVEPAAAEADDEDATDTGTLPSEAELVEPVLNDALDEEGQVGSALAEEEEEVEEEAAEVLAEAEAAREEALDLTPRAVAQYLLMTGDFSGFSDAMRQLIASNLVRPQDAIQYRDEVGLEYERLLQEQVGEKMNNVQDVVSEPARGEEEAAIDEDSDVKAYLNKLYPSTPLDGDVELALRKMQLQALIAKEASLDDLLQTLTEEYILKVIQEADSEKQSELAESLDSWELEQLIDMIGDEEASQDEDLMTSSGEALPLEEDSQETQTPSVDEEEQQLESIVPEKISKVTEEQDTEQDEETGPVADNIQ